MTPSTDVAPAAKGGVPELASRPASDIITSEDVKLDRLYIGQAISEPVQNGLVSIGDLFLAQDKDDPSPNILANKGDKDGVIFHYLALRKGKSRSLQGVLETWRYDDPNVPADAWTTYQYLIAIPSVQTDLPVRLLLTRTGRSAAQKLNTVLHRAVGQQPPYELAFRITTDERQNAKGRFYVPLISQVEPEPEAIAVAERLYQEVEAARPVVSNTDDDPAI